MKPKKAEFADVDKISGLYSKIGLIITLAIVILAFQWTKYEKQESQQIFAYQGDEEDEEVIDNTKEPPPPPRMDTPPEIEIVDDKVEIENKVDIETQDNVEEQVIEPPKIIKKTEEVVDDEIFMVVEDMPEFPGGDAARQNWIVKNMVYPEIERENGIQGLVVVSFVVEKDGSITNIKVLKSVSPNIDAEAIRVVKAMPGWKPGKQRGKPVRVTINLPLRFTLQ